MEKLKTVGAREGKTEHQTIVKAWIEERLQSAGDKGRALRISLRPIGGEPTLDCQPSELFAGNLYDAIIKSARNPKTCCRDQGIQYRFDRLQMAAPLSFDQHSQKSDVAQVETRRNPARAPLIQQH